MCVRALFSKLIDVKINLQEKLLILSVCVRAELFFCHRSPPTHSSAAFLTSELFIRASTEVILTSFVDTTAVIAV